MSLPQVDGWVIDFRTAISIFESNSNERINHLIERCENNTLKICHCEEQVFKGAEIVKGPFIIDNNCVYEPDSSVFQRCETISVAPNGKQLLQGNESAIYITAIALEENFGVISNHRSPIFDTVYDLCASYGVPVYSADEYFSQFN